MHGLINKKECFYVAEEYLASIFGVYEIFYLEIKAVCSFETSVNSRQTTRCHISEGCSVHSNRL
jgi:hypothetical protein